MVDIDEYCNSYDKWNKPVANASSTASQAAMLTT